MLSPGVRRTWGPGGDGIGAAVGMDGDVGDIVDLLVGQGVVHANQHIAAAPVDDVLHLVPVEVDRGSLPFADDHDLFAVGFAVACRIAVADREEGEPLFGEAPLAEVGHVPSQGVVADLAALVAAFFPLLRRAGCPCGEHETVFVEKFERLAYGAVYFGSFHGFG